jgi:lysozyme
MYMSSIARLKMQNREKKMMKYYDDLGPGKGNCSWGIGMKEHRGPCTAEELSRKVTEEQVATGFGQRVRDAERAVERNVKVQLTQAQFDALVSLTFNRGPTGAFHAYELLNAGDFDGAANWIATLTSSKVKKKGHWVSVLVPGLIPRRAEESAPFRNAANAPIRSAAK